MSDARPATPWTKVVAVACGAGLVLTLLLLAFTWPTKTAEPRNLPIAVAGAEQAVSGLVDQLEKTGTFEVTAVADRDAAVDAIESRDVYGAVVVGAQGAPEVLTASAAGASPAQILRGVAQTLQVQVAEQAAAAGQPVPKVAVTDVVPLSEDDSTGAGLGAAAFPLAMGGVLGGVLATLLVVGLAQRIGAVVAYAAVGGLLSTLVMHSWFGYVPASFGAAWLAFAVALAATAFFVVGLSSLIGRAGIAVGAILTVLLGNPLAGAAMPWQFIAEPWGAIGQYLVPGASSTLVRTLSYFPDASSAQQWWTLAAWIAVGAVMLVIGSLRSARATSAAVAPAPAA